MRLSREIRFALVPPDKIPSGKPGNSWAGWPATNLVVPQLVLRCVIEGDVDPKTGYLCNIKVIDELLRSIVMSNLVQPQLPCSAESVLRIVCNELNSRWTHASDVIAVTLAISPYVSYTVFSESQSKESQVDSSKELVNDQPILSNKVHLTEQFEFSAAHRLHSNELSDKENQALFGKCNNPEGHGHNYVVEVTVSNEVEKQGQVIATHEFESTVKQLIIDRLDHKHLNRDIDYFAEVNPSVENIVVAIFDWLDDQFGKAKLEKIRLYETPKTWAEYSGSE